MKLTLEDKTLLAACVAFTLNRTKPSTENASLEFRLTQLNVLLNQADTVQLNGIPHDADQD